MIRSGRRMPRIMGVAVTAACALALSNCSSGDGDASQVTTTTISDEMRPVPTVPEAGTESSTPAAPDSGGPPVTELIGDPKPNVDSQENLPPLPGGPVVDGCTRLAGVAAGDAVAAAAGVAPRVESIDTTACRFSGGGVVAEVHYVDETTVASEWFGREGIGTVGEVSGDAVGLTSYLAPGSDSGEGFTIAMISRRQGVIVAVSGSSADRDLAVELAVLAQGTT